MQMDPARRYTLRCNTVSIIQLTKIINFFSRKLESVSALNRLFYLGLEP